jgi:hypothetical protein
MSTTINRKKTGIAALGATAAAVLLSLSPTIAHAAPGDDGPTPPDSSNGQTAALSPPPLMQADENPVVFTDTKTTQYITLSWTPYPAQPVRVISLKDGVQEGPGAIIYPNVPDPDVIGYIDYGKTYKIHLETLGENGQPKLAGPVLTITTKLVTLTTKPPEQPKITTTLIPRLPILPPGRSR